MCIQALVTKATVERPRRAARETFNDVVGKATGTVKPVLEWLRTNGRRRLAVHLDLDVLDPSLTISCFSAIPICRRAHWTSWRGAR